MRTLWLFVVLAATVTACGDEDSGEDSQCTADTNEEVDAEALGERCAAVCEAAIGCADHYMDEDAGTWVCELRPACRPGLSPAEAFEEMAACEGTCEEFVFAAQHQGYCPGLAAATVDCFAALSCEKYETVPPVEAIDKNCAESVTCISSLGCFK